MFIKSNFTIIIPVWNEEEVIEQVLLDIINTSLEYGWEIIVVDDGSNDATGSIAARMFDGKREKKVISIKHSGKDKAIWVGVLQARGEWIGVIDGDGQYCVKDFKKMIEAAMKSNVDCVWDKRAKREDILFRLIISLAGRITKKILLGKCEVSDTGCGMFICRTEILRRIIELCPYPRGQLHCHLPEIIESLGGRVCEMPVNHFRRACGKAKYGLINRLTPGWLSLLDVRDLIDKQRE